MLTAEKSECLTKRLVDPVSLHASLGAEGAKERCVGLQTTVLVTVSLGTSFLNPRCHKCTMDPPATEV